MTAYLYVLWAVEDDLVKLGISARPAKRLAIHSGNSSNPVTFTRWKLYQFASLSDARKIETLAVGSLAARGHRFREKRELFNCDPTVVTAEIERSCKEAGIRCLKNFPLEFDEVIRSLGDFPSLPDFALGALNADQRAAYWRGARDAFWCLSYFEGLAISRSQFLQLHGNISVNEEAHSELWTTLVDHFRNLNSFDATERSEARRVAMAALEQIKLDRRDAYVEWQEIEDSDEAA